ncbi:MAG: hypothetical protein ACQEQH_08980, partial [Bacillota bacterium]
MLKKVIIITLLVLIIFSVNLKAQIVIKSKLTQEYKLKEGITREGKIVIKNTSKQKTFVKLYKRDYSFNANGNNYYSKPGLNQRSNAEWIFLDKKMITLLPFEEKSVKYVIKVPDNKKYSGTYWSMIMVEKDRSVSGTGINNLDQNIGFKQSIRYGIQIITNFSIDEKLNLRYKNVEIKKGDGNRYKFELTVLNNNNYLVDSFNKLVLINKNNGDIIKEYVFQKRKLYPNTSIKLKKE